jgi:hypothetical protein
MSWSRGQRYVEEESTVTVASSEAPEPDII